MDQVRSEAVSQRRFVLLLVAAFGALALVMAAVGVYGVMALIVSERTAGDRHPPRAGRAARRTCCARSSSQGVTLAAIGRGRGPGRRGALTPLVRTQLYGVRPLDPPTLAGVPVILIAIAALACFVPARRAMAIDPVNALRNS